MKSMIDSIFINLLLYYIINFHTSDIKILGNYPPKVKSKRLTFDPLCLNGGVRAEAGKESNELEEETLGKQRKNAAINPSDFLHNKLTHLIYSNN